MDKKQPVHWLFLNAAYTFIVLAVALVAAMVARWIINPFLPVDLMAEQGGDYSRNFFMVFPIHGIASGIAFLLVAYFGGKSNGFKTCFRFRVAISTPVFILQAILAVVVYYFLFIYMCEWFTNLPTWYLSGFFAAAFGIFDASNIYESVAAGYAEIDNLYFLYLWLHALLELVFIVGACFLIKVGRSRGEKQAFLAHEARLNELQHEKDRIASKKSL